MNIKNLDSQSPSTMQNSTYYIRLPLIIAITLVAGIFIGAKMFGTRTEQEVNSVVLKYREIFKYIDAYYVDSVQVDKIAETGIKKMLEDLDPHTAYIPAKEVETMNAPLEGDFDGIGIEFTIFKDTIEVVATVQGGPSEEVGIQSGDKIIAVDGKNIAGIKISNKSVFEYLRGKKGTKVQVTIKRRGQENPLDFTITRNKIPTYTVEGSFMLDKETGYIRVTRFGVKTYEEFRKSMEQLVSQGIKRMVLDLRDNPGGYMDKATKIADEFIAGEKLIVYTDGKENRFDNKDYASFTGMFEEGSLIVLIDEGSASASEIVAGALQDNDRALIVGRRSFGKGLVQKPIILTDGSELRLTISRYYTPSGRSIQKKYEKGHLEEYSSDISKRYEHGELYSADSVKFDESQKYKTAGGRTVYGGGGIMPDHFIAQDTSYFSNYLSALYRANLVREFALEYANSHKIKLKAMNEIDYIQKFELSDLEMQNFIAFAQKEDVKFVAKDYEKSKKFLKNQLKGYIARTIWQKENTFSRILAVEDHDINEAMKLFEEADKLIKK